MRADAGQRGTRTGSGAPALRLSADSAARSPTRGASFLAATLVAADLIGLALAFFVAHALRSPTTPRAAIEPEELLLFASVLPIWILVATVNGLYQRDVERADHSTVDDVVGIFSLATATSWLLTLGAWWTGAREASMAELAIFWISAVAFIVLGRACARSLARRRCYAQRAVIVGAGNVGQLVARKLLKHPEYGIELVGFVDADAKQRRSDLDRVTILGPPEHLPAIVRSHGVDRVVFAFSKESAEQMLFLVRSIQDLDIQIDIVPRLFDVVGPCSAIHSVEGLPLVGLSVARRSRPWALAKRTVDVVGAAIGLALTAPLFAVIAWRIKRDSEGPVFFRQTRLTLDMRQFTTLKFRTMKSSTDESAHRDYVRSMMTKEAAPAGNGLFKLEQSSVVTPVGRWLRTTSLDELPQLVNVLRGDMSLVGPRPCIPYETEHFQPHHFERFRVRAGLTGMWQVTARANASFAEALDMDVAYVRSASLGLDLRLLCRTPTQLLRQRGSTA